MPEKWTGNLIGKMHNNGIKQKQLAEKLGFNTAYIGMILNGKRNPPGIRQKMENAVDEILKGN